MFSAFKNNHNLSDDNYKKLNHELDELKNKNDELYKSLNKINELETSIKEIKEEKENLITKYDKILDSYYNQFTTIFLYCDLKTKGPLRNFQIFNQELLNFVVNVCKKHKLDYWIDFGTLLGAVRHGGYVPWDDDIDIGMMRKDYNKFISVFQSEIVTHGLEEDIVFQVNERRTNAGWKISFLQIMFLSHRKHMLAGMDIFPYDYINNPPENLEEKYNLEQRNFVQKMKDDMNIMQYLEEYYQEFNISMEKSDHIIPGIDNNSRGEIHGYPFVLMNSDLIFPLDKISFNAREYCCPRNNDEYLKLIYGDYSSIPQIIATHDRAKLLQKEYDDDYYEKYINKLKNINENF